MVFALPGEPGLTELSGDFKIHFHDRQGDFYWWGLHPVSVLLFIGLFHEICFLVTYFICYASPVHKILILLSS